MDNGQLTMDNAEEGPTLLFFLRCSFFPLWEQEQLIGQIRPIAPI